jgi:hypothetical protein
MAVASLIKNEFDSPARNERSVTPAFQNLPPMEEVKERKPDPDLEEPKEEKLVIGKKPEVKKDDEGPQIEIF